MNSKNPSTKPRFLAVPGSHGWESWQFGPESPAIKTGNASDCAGLSLPVTSTVALPSSEWCFFADWYVGEDEQMKEMIFLQMEVRGIVARNKNQAVWDYRFLERRGQSVLVSGACLGEDVTSFRNMDAISEATASFSVWSFEESAVTLWQELGHWNCAVMDGKNLLAVQRLGGDKINAQLVSELLCLLVQLEMENFAGKVKKLILWDVTEDEEAFAKLGLPLTSHERPHPNWPQRPFDLLPLNYREKNVREVRKKQLRRVATGLAIAAVILFAALVAHTAWVWTKHRGIEAYLAQTGGEVSEIRAAAGKWESIAPALERDRSALEIFFRCARNLPAQGVNFTLFHYKPSEIVIVGEASNVPGVVEFQSRLSKDKELAEYQWKIPPPRILPNNIARFEISGIRPEYGTVQDTE